MRKKRKKYLILILLFFISIGFAFLSAALNINGLIGYRGNSWDVHLENVQIITNDIDADSPIINDSKDSVNFSVSFSVPSEEFSFSVDVVNDGTIDVMLGELIRTGIDSTNSDYIDYSVTYMNDNIVNINDLISHGSKVRIKVKLEYKNTTERVAPAGTNDYSLSLKYILATEEANKVDSYYESEQNTTFVLNNAKSNTLSNLKIYGNTSQTQYTGQNLYNFRDVNENDTTSIGIGTTVDDDGWITVSRDNTSGSSNIYSNYYTNNLDLVIGDTYTVVVEIKSVSGTGSLAYVSKLKQDGVSNGQLGYKYEKFSDLSAGDIIITTSPAYESGKWGLRTYGCWSAGESGSVTFRLSVIKGTEVTADNFVYEPYVGNKPSPSIDYPQDVHNVNNNNYIDISGKNLFDVNSVKVGFVFPANGEIDFNNYWWKHTGLIGVSPNKKYTFSWLSDINFFQVSFSFFDINKNIVDVKSVVGSMYDYTFIVPQNVYYVRIAYSVIVSGAAVTRENIQFELGEEVTEYKEFVGNNRFEFNLNSLELSKLDSNYDYIYYKDKSWFLHKETGYSKIKDISIGDTSKSGYYRFTKSIKNASDTDRNVNKNIAYCNSLALLNQGDTFNQIEGFTIRYGAMYFYLDIMKNMSRDIAEEWLSNYNVYLYYPLSDFTDIKITDTTLTNQLNAILNDNLFDGTNYITVSGSDLTPTIEFDYVHN